MTYYNNRSMSSQTTRLSLQDVRCFQGTQQGELRPITLLVGENSTGKSTFLGCLNTIHRVLDNPFYFRPDPDFNEDPFLMGSFREIVRARRGPSGKITEFKIGLGFSPSRGGNRQITLGFREQGSQPAVSSVCWEFGYGCCAVTETGQEKTLVSVGDLKYELSDSIEQALQMLSRATSGGRGPEDTTESRAAMDAFGMFMSRWWEDIAPRHRVIASWGLPNWRHNSLVSIAPLRAKRQRTYDPIRETSSSEGAHVPMRMMRLARDGKGEWKNLHDDLVAFGKESGMFSDVRVRGPQGQHMSDPFQLQFKVRSGIHSNIVDVGYGVSQSLPILVDISSSKSTTFLLQQPEVHLHPRGQAELASLFVKSARSHHNRFLIETHSDYIIDRVRIDVRSGKLAAKDVSILYFEPNGTSVEIHNIQLDESGNLLNVPTGYRDFFAKETDRLLGFDE